MTYSKKLTVIFAFATLSLLACSLGSQSRHIYTTNFNEYTHNSKRVAGIHYECNQDSVVVSPNDSLLVNTVKNFTDSINADFFVNFYDSASLYFEWTSSKALPTGFEFKANLPNDSALIPQALDSVVKRQYKGMLDSTGELHITSWDTTRLNDAERKLCQRIFAFVHAMKSTYQISSIRSGENLEIKGFGRDYAYAPKTFINCEPKDQFVKIFHEWVIHEYSLERIRKQYDRRNPSPYETIETLDSTTFKYRIKNPEVMKKPCNLRSAHHILDSIFVLNKTKVDSTTNMASFHTSTGLWMRNQWGMWSGKSRLAPLFKAKGIIVPDDMSEYILDTYKDYKVFTQKHPEASIDSLYKNWGDLDCGR